MIRLSSRPKENRKEINTEEIKVNRFSKQRDERTRIERRLIGDDSRQGTGLWCSAVLSLTTKKDEKLVNDTSIKQNLLDEECEVKTKVIKLLKNRLSDINSNIAYHSIEKIELSKRLSYLEDQIRKQDQTLVVQDGLIKEKDELIVKLNSTINQYESVINESKAQMENMKSRILEQHLLLQTAISDRENVIGEAQKLKTSIPELEFQIEQLKEQNKMLEYKVKASLGSSINKSGYNYFSNYNRPNETAKDLNQINIDLLVKIEDLKEKIFDLEKNKAVTNELIELRNQRIKQLQEEKLDLEEMINKTSNMNSWLQNRLNIKEEENKILKHKIRTAK